MFKITFLLTLFVIQLKAITILGSDETRSDVHFFGNYARRIYIGENAEFVTIPYYTRRTGMIIITKPEIIGSVVKLVDKRDTFDIIFEKEYKPNTYGLTAGMKMNEETITFTEKQIYQWTINYEVEGCQDMNIKFGNVNINLIGKTISYTEMILVEKNDEAKLIMTCNEPVLDCTYEEATYTNNKQKFKLNKVKLSFILI